MREFKIIVQKKRQYEIEKKNGKHPKGFSSQNSNRIQKYGTTIINYMVF